MDGLVKLISGALVDVALNVYFWWSSRPRATRRQLSSSTTEGCYECEPLWPDDDMHGAEHAWDHCKKTPNSHANFTPVLEFSERNLPGHCFNRQRSKEYFQTEYIKTFAKLAVRLRVDHISHGRSDSYTLSGHGTLRTGSGWVSTISPGRGPYPRPECSDSSLSTDKWWVVFVSTAAHVVFDREEAERTKVDLFYDDENSEVTTLCGYDIGYKSLREDVSTVMCCTHDGDLVDILLRIKTQIKTMDQTFEHFWEPNLCVVISHPHGQPKKISVGKTKRVDEMAHEPYKSARPMMYIVDTCRGSSGGPVLSQVNRKDPQTGRWVARSRVDSHSKSYGDGLQIQCGAGGCFPENAPAGAEGFSTEVLTQDAEKSDTLHSADIQTIRELNALVDKVKQLREQESQAGNSPSIDLRITLALGKVNRLTVPENSSTTIEKVRQLTASENSSTTIEKVIQLTASENSSTTIEKVRQLTASENSSTTIEKVRQLTASENSSTTIEKVIQLTASENSSTTIEKVRQLTASENSSTTIEKVRQLTASENSSTTIEKVRQLTASENSSTTIEKVRQLTASENSSTTIEKVRQLTASENSSTTIEKVRQLTASENSSTTIEKVRQLTASENSSTTIEKVSYGTFGGNIVNQGTPDTLSDVSDMEASGDEGEARMGFDSDQDMV